MPCKTCGHTLQNLGVADQRVFWCPRCGTIKIDNPGFADEQAPTVVKCARDFLAGMRTHLTDSEIDALVLALGEAVGLRDYVRGATGDR